jgi:hypothetical protein
MQLREMLAQSMLKADLRHGFQLNDVSAGPPSLQSRISRPVAQYTSSSGSSSPSLPDTQPPTLPQFDHIVRETLLAFASEHAAELTAAKKVAPVLASKQVDMVDAAVNPRTPTPGPSLHNAVTSPVMWAQRHQTTQADSEHRGERRKGSPLAVRTTSQSFGTNAMTPVFTNHGGGVDAGLSPMPQYGSHDAGVSPMPIPGGRDVGLTPMPMPSGRDVGLTPMPMPSGHDVGLTPMPMPTGRDVGLTPMPQYGSHDAGVSPMPMPGGRDVGLTPMPQYDGVGHDVGISPIMHQGARQVDASQETTITHSLPDWWTRLHQPDGSSSSVAAGRPTHRTELVKSLDPQISEGEILLSSDGETFPSRKLPADTVGPDPFQSVRGTLMDRDGSDFSDGPVVPLPTSTRGGGGAVGQGQEEQLSEGQLSRGSMSEGEEPIGWSSRSNPPQKSRGNRSARQAFLQAADSDSDVFVSSSAGEMPARSSGENDL